MTVTQTHVKCTVNFQNIQMNQRKATVLGGFGIKQNIFQQLQ